MGYFAVLAAEQQSGQTDIRRCHINVWSLPSLVPGRRLFYFDVGLELHVTAGEIDAIRMLLPFRVEEVGPSSGHIVHDLSSILRDRDTAELVFGGPVQHSTSAGVHTLKVNDYDDDMTLIEIDPHKTKADENYKPRIDASLYHVQLERTVATGERVYLRLRWTVFGAAPLWRWSRVAAGATIDLRLCDVRESRFTDLDRGLRAQIQPIEEANVFVMSPGRLSTAASSPQPKHVRALETAAWRSYLRSAPHFGAARGMVVHYFQRPKKTDPIGADSPFRVYLDLRRPASRSWWVHIVQVFVGVLLAWAVLRLSGSIPDLDFSDIKLRSALPVVVGGTFLAVLGFVSWLRAFSEDWFRRPRAALRRVERLLLRVNLH